jgi:invasion protein IalB
MTTPRLFARPMLRISACMRAFFCLLIPATLLAAPQALGQTRPAAPATTKAADSNAPKLVGKFGDWRTASHVEAGQNVCYAYTGAQSSVPATSGRGTVNLTVTQRPQGPRDAVAITAGFTYAAATSVAVQVDTTAMEFYTAQRSAFARDGKLAVQTFLKGKQVLARSPNPKGGTVTDQFSLKGFAGAYAAINKACPPQAGAPK